jgi:transposase
VDTPGQILVRRTKRLWTDEEKRSICFQTAAPGVSVAQVARRYAVNANMVFKWLRDPRYTPEPASVPSQPEGMRFLPVEIVAEAKAPATTPSAENHIEIELAGGHRMRISGSYDPEALARLIRGLTA